MATMIDGIPVPGRTDAADAPANFTAQTEAISLRLKSIDGQDDDSINSHHERITTLEGLVTGLQTSTTQTQADLDALELKYANLLSWTKIGLIRIEARSVVQSTDAKGFYHITFAKPFKKVPLMLLTPGSGTGMNTATGSGWNTTAAPGPYTHDNVYGGLKYTISASRLTCGGMKAGTKMRMNYLAIGEAQYTDRAANLGGPGWDILNPF